MRDFWIGAIVGLAVGVLVGIAWQDAYCIIKTALKAPNRKRYRMTKPKFQVWMLVMLFAFVQILTGVFMIVQYGRLTGFIDCQAQYNQATSDIRDSRVAATGADQEGLYDVLMAVSAGDPLKTQRRVERALKLHEANLKTQEENPYLSPSDTCGTVNP